MCARLLAGALDASPANPGRQETPFFALVIQGNDETSDPWCFAKTHSLQVIEVAGFPDKGAFWKIKQARSPECLGSPMNAVLGGHNAYKIEGLACPSLVTAGAGCV